MPTWKLGAGARDRQLGRAQARRAVADRRARARRAGRRGGRARRRAQRPARVRRDRRPGARPPHGRRQGRLHRLERGRQAVPRLRGRVEHEERPARVRRQVAERRSSPTCPTSTSPSRRRRRASSATRARCAAPARGCCCRSRSPTRCSRSSPPRPASGQPGDPLDPATRMGSMVDETQMERVLGYIETGTAEGAELRVGRRPRARGERRLLRRADDLQRARATTCGSRRRRSSARC